MSTLDADEDIKAISRLYEFFTFYDNDSLHLVVVGLNFLFMWSFSVSIIAIVN